MAVILRFNLIGRTLKLALRPSRRLAVELGQPNQWL
jgi:hypothetical protein